MALSAGFEYEGTLRKFMIRKKGNVDICMYSLLNSSWEKVQRDLSRKSSTIKALQKRRKIEKIKEKDS